MHQVYKSFPRVDMVYCPLDLYSGEELRVRRAVMGLWERWRASAGEGNSLRIYQKGSLVLPVSSFEAVNDKMC